MLSFPLPMMNASAARDLAAALRSGKYKQELGMLRSDVGFCAIGVLCDLFLPQTDLKWERAFEATECYPNGVYAIGKNTGGLPLEIQRLVGGYWIYAKHNFTFPESSSIEKDQPTAIQNLNDSGEFTFDDLADWLEYHAEKMEAQALCAIQEALKDVAPDHVNGGDEPQVSITWDAVEPDFAVS